MKITKINVPAYVSDTGELLAIIFRDKDGHLIHHLTPIASEDEIVRLQNEDNSAVKKNIR